MPEPAPRWRRRPESRRDELLDAAQHLFVTRGLEATTVADIVAAAGLAKGSFYRYFESRDDLFTALKGRFFDRMHEHLAQAIAAAAGCDEPSPDLAGAPLLVAGLTEGVEQLGRIADATIRASIEFLFAEAELIAVWSGQHRHGREPELTEGLSRLIDVLCRVISKAMTAGLIDGPAPRRTARFLVFAIETTTTYAILSEPDAEPEPLIAATTVLARRVLGLPDPARPSSGPAAGQGRAAAQE